MGELQKSDPLQLIPQSPDGDRLIVNPTEGRKINCYQSSHEFNLYLDQDDFINATEDFREVSLDQINDCEAGIIKVKNSLRKEMNSPDEIRMFAKNDNLFLKPTG